MASWVSWWRRAAEVWISNAAVTAPAMSPGPPSQVGRRSLLGVSGCSKSIGTAYSWLGSCLRARGAADTSESEWLRITGGLERGRARQSFSCLVTGREGNALGK
ncbi:uncharacterized protein IWZ02DRAFT_58196 [Phyllosticta citriasiana]|uniref:uncharacterized protein n=1 Tax=Phyllosticta citriasiana TaxID=595635 RepID=UPI0030FD361B